MLLSTAYSTQESSFILKLDDDFGSDSNHHLMKMPQPWSRLASLNPAMLHVCTPELELYDYIGMLPPSSAPCGYNQSTHPTDISVRYCKTLKFREHFIFAQIRESARFANFQCSRNFSTGPELSKTFYGLKIGPFLRILWSIL